MAYVIPKISATMNVPMQNLAPVTTYTGTVTNALNSSVFLSRMFIPAEMIVTEIDVILGLNFAASNNGAGTISRSVGIYTFGNSTSLQLLTLQTGSASTNTINASFSGTSAWTTGTTTVGGSNSLTQFQGGWNGSILQPMTLPTPFTLFPGDYVVGHMFNFAQASSTWSVSIFGLAQAQSSITSASITLVRNSGLRAGSFFTNSTQSVSALSNLNTKSSTMSTSGTTTGTRTVWSAAPSGAVLFSSGILSAGSVFSGISGITGFSSLGTSFGGYRWAFVSGSNVSGNPTMFQHGLLSSGNLPSSLAFTNALIRISGSAAMIQPWFALIGS